MAEWLRHPLVETLVVTGLDPGLAKNLFLHFFLTKMNTVEGPWNLKKVQKIGTYFNWFWIIIFFRSIQGFWNKVWLTKVELLTHFSWSWKYQHKRWEYLNHILTLTKYWDWHSKRYEHCRLLLHRWQLQLLLEIQMLPKLCLKNSRRNWKIYKVGMFCLFIISYKIKNY